MRGSNILIVGFAMAVAILAIYEFGDDAMRHYVLSQIDDSTFGLNID